MNPRRNQDHDSNAKFEPKIVAVSDVIEQIRRLNDIRRKVSEGYYDRSDVIAEVAAEIHRRISR